jgi:DNA-directed RNA polymerase specialized sigma24 family protein
VAFDDHEQGFRAFVASVEPSLRRALMAQYGADRGREAAMDALSFAWEHWSMVRELRNPPGYLYRVAQSATKSRKQRPLFDRPVEAEPWIEPGLPAAMAALSHQQRVAVFLVYVHDTEVSEVAQLLRLRKTTVHTHLTRGLASLRKSLNVTESGARIADVEVANRRVGGANDV